MIARKPAMIISTLSAIDQPTDSLTKGTVVVALMILSSWSFEIPTISKSKA
jgi:hypothetical protein